jgi:MFS family permease
MGAIVGLLSSGFGYTSLNASLFGVFFVIFGVIGSIVHAIVADKYQKYRF